MFVPGGGTRSDFRFSPRNGTGTGTENRRADGPGVPVGCGCGGGRYDVLAVPPYEVILGGGGIPRSKGSPMTRGVLSDAAACEVLGKAGSERRSGEAVSGVGVRPKPGSAGSSGRAVALSG